MLDQYMQIISEKSQMNILIAYVSAYGYTKEAAHLIAEGILETKGITVDITDIENISSGRTGVKDNNGRWITCWFADN